MRQATLDITYREAAIGVVRGDGSIELNGYKQRQLEAFM